MKKSFVYAYMYFKVFLKIVIRKGKKHYKNIIKKYIQKNIFIKYEKKFCICVYLKIFESNNYMKC